MRLTKLRLTKAKIILFLIVMGLGVAIFFWFRAQQAKYAAFANKEQAPIVVETVIVKRSSENSTIGTIGSLLANEGAIIRPEIDGRIEQILFKEGEQVKKGDLLIKLDDSVHQAQLAEAEAQLKLNKITYERSRKLAESGVLSKQNLDESEAKYRAAEASFSLVKANLTKTLIYAPFNGIVGFRKVSLGNFVNKGQDIVNIEDIDPIKAEFNVSDNYISEIKQGKKIEVKLDAFPGEIFYGEIYAIDPKIDEKGRSISVRAYIPNKDHKLKPGLFARIDIITEKNNDIILIPEEALVPADGENNVYKIEGEVAKLTKVLIGQRIKNGVIIEEGLNEGDVIVTGGQIKLHDGSKIQLIQTPPNK